MTHLLCASWREEDSSVEQHEQVCCLVALDGLLCVERLQEWVQDVTQGCVDVPQDGRIL